MIPRPGTFPLSEMTEEARSILKFVPNLSYLSGVEVGTLRGKTAAILLLHRPGLHLACVDNWDREFLATIVDDPDDVAMAWVRNMKAWQERVKRIPLTSLEAAVIERGGDGHEDFVYIDADHSYEATAADIAAWWPHVRPGGLLMGHDYGRSGPMGKDAGWGVAQAVGEFLAANDLELHGLEDTTWAIVKT